MKRRIVRKLARCTINLCDWMMGYHGVLIQEAIIATVLTLPTMFLFMWSMIVMS